MDKVIKFENVYEYFCLFTLYHFTEEKLVLKYTHFLPFHCSIWLAMWQNFHCAIWIPEHIYPYDILHLTQNCYSFVFLHAILLWSWTYPFVKQIARKNLNKACIISRWWFAFWTTTTFIYWNYENILMPLNCPIKSDSSSPRKLSRKIHLQHITFSSWTIWLCI